MDELQERIFKGQCFNNACTLIAGSGQTVNPETVYQLAQDLYDKGIELNWVECQNKDSTKLQTNL